MRRILALGLALSTVVAGGAAHAELDRAHGAWSALLARHVKLSDPRGSASRVDYAGFARERAVLQRYLAQLARTSADEIAALPRADRIAFWINAYNAATVELILGEYPKHASIRDYGSLLRSPWQRPFVRLGGETLTLDQIEHERLRGPRGFGEPRIHFAVNCASLGCPMLREEAYLGARLEAQLAEQALRFLSDRTRNRWNAQRGRFELSAIFDWYAEDFARGDVRAFLRPYATALGAPPSAFAGRGAPISHLDYDWRLNDAQTR
jgi:hypothetical protein